MPLLLPRVRRSWYWRDVLAHLASCPASRGCLGRGRGPLNCRAGCERKGASLDQCTHRRPALPACCRATANLWPVTPGMSSGVKGLRDAIITILSKVSIWGSRSTPPFERRPALPPSAVHLKASPAALCRLQGFCIGAIIAMVLNLILPQETPTVRASQRRASPAVCWCPANAAARLSSKKHCKPRAVPRQCPWQPTSQLPSACPALPCRVPPGGARDGRGHRRALLPFLRPLLHRAG